MSAVPPSANGESGTSVPILKLAANSTAVVVFLGPLRGSVQHWVQGRTVPCQLETCPGPLHKHPVRYYAYAPGRAYTPSTGLWKAQVLQITAALEQTLRGRVLRGEIWALARQQHKLGRGQMTGRYLGQAPPEQLHPAFDVTPTLQLAFGEVYFPLDSPNPFPDRLIVEDVAMEVPDLAGKMGDSPTPEAPKQLPKNVLELFQKVSAKKEQA